MKSAKSRPKRQGLTGDGLVIRAGYSTVSIDLGSLEGMDSLHHILCETQRVVSIKPLTALALAVPHRQEGVDESAWEALAST